MEFTSRLREDAPDQEDVLLQKALADLQDIVDSFLARTGRSINDLTEDEQQALVDTIQPHLDLERSVSPDIHLGLPIVTGGAGGFLITDSEGALLGAQQTSDGDVVTGVISNIRSYPVPSRHAILQPTEPYEPIEAHDQSLSAIIILEDAKFHTDPSDDGTHQLVHDLGDMQVVVPILYKMETRVADIYV